MFINSFAKFLWFLSKNIVFLFKKKKKKKKIPKKKTTNKQTFLTIFKNAMFNQNLDSLWMVTDLRKNRITLLEKSSEKEKWVQNTDFGPYYGGGVLSTKV